MGLLGSKQMEIVHHRIIWLKRQDAPEADWMQRAEWVKRGGIAVQPPKAIGQVWYVVIHNQMAKLQHSNLSVLFEVLGAQKDFLATKSTVNTKKSNTRNSAGQLQHTTSATNNQGERREAADDDI